MQGPDHFYKSENDFRKPDDRQINDLDEMTDMRLLQRYGILRADFSVDPRALRELISIAGAYINVVFNNVATMHTHQMSMATINAAINGSGIQMADTVESISHMMNVSSTMAVLHNVREACDRAIKAEEGVQPIKDEKELDDLVKNLFQRRNPENGTHEA